MLQSRTKFYEVYRDAEKISLVEIIWKSDEALRPGLQVTVLIDGHRIENVTFERDLTSRAYAMPPATNVRRSSGVTILFGEIVQEILDNFADCLLPPMKPFGLNPTTGEKVLDPYDRTNTREIENSKRKINGHRFVWQK